MKKSIFFTVFILGIFLFSTSVAAANCVKLLKIEEPDKGKNKLNLNLEHAKAIVAGFNLEGVTADIELTDQTGNILVVLGEVKDGSIKWAHKVVDGTFLQVKFDNGNYEMVLEKVKEKALKPGFSIRVSGVGDCEITFIELPDLSLRMKYPINAAPGQALADEISITVANNGTVEVKNVEVQLVISGDAQIPVQSAAYSENFQEDGLLEGGQETVASIKPGESLTVKFKGTLKIPADTSPARYYLGAVVDPGKKIEELNEENNLETGFIMITVPEPKRLVVDLPESQLVYQPAGFSLKILCEGAPLSDGQDWRKCSIRPYIHQLKQATWEDSFWEIDTIDRSIWRITGIKFCQKGGTAKEIKMKVEVKGGSKTTPPLNFTLGFPGVQLEYEPAEGKFRVTAFEDQLIHASLWRIFKIKAHLYQLKHLSWSDFYWEIDAFKKELRQVTGGNFGQTDVGGTIKVLNATVNVED